ncbi:metallophosphoesterase family protein [Massilia sp. CF038]|uniref:metallophosphoesterase family protein n=1 Tax=Massilia sp. CF038 TaxID=1881045 RepID=UPI00093302B0|nr:metallophosphoesterase family protein [Massilia sp. CF038]
MIRIGVISDTHGMLRPQALAALAGCDHIIHGGDIGGQDILDQLAALAPLTAVRGNNDGAPWAAAVPHSAQVQLGGLTLHVVHDIATLAIDPVAAGVDVVIYGHSHKPLAEQRAGVLYLNPGSAGPRRFKLPVSVAELVLDQGPPQARIIELAV